MQHGKYTVIVKYNVFIHGARRFLAMFLSHICPGKYFYHISFLSVEEGLVLTVVEMRCILCRNDGHSWPGRDDEGLDDIQRRETFSAAATV